MSFVQNTVVFLSEFSYKQFVSQLNEMQGRISTLSQKSLPTDVYHYLPPIMTDLFVHEQVLATLKK